MLLRPEVNKVSIGRQFLETEAAPHLRKSTEKIIVLFYSMRIKTSIATYLFMIGLTQSLALSVGYFKLNILHGVEFSEYFLDINGNEI